MAEKSFKVLMSERCFRFKPDAIPGHAPGGPGVYEFVTFDAARRAKVLYVGVALDQTVQQVLMEHLLGRRSPTANELFGAAPDVYFDFVAKSDAKGPEDLKDIAAALIARHKPPFNQGSTPATGRFEKVHVQEVDIL